MKELYKNLYVGAEYDCFYENKHDWIVIHACKSPCHQKAVGYKGNLNPTHPNYLTKETEDHLYLNMVDMTAPLSHKFTEPIITTAMNFIERNIKTKNVLIHCNLGMSRSPALALLFLAKKAKILPNTNYKDAKEEFVKLFPLYKPGRGIEIYLTEYWDEI